MQVNDVLKDKKKVDGGIINYSSLHCLLPHKYISFFLSCFFTCYYQRLGADRGFMKNHASQAHTSNILNILQYSMCMAFN